MSPIPPTALLAEVQGKIKECTLELVSYPSGVCIELVVTHDETPVRRQMIYSERVTYVSKLAERLKAREIGECHTRDQG